MHINCNFRLNFVLLLFGRIVAFFASFTHTCRRTCNSVIPFESVFALSHKPLLSKYLSSKSGEMMLKLDLILSLVISSLSIILTKFFSKKEFCVIYERRPEKKEIPRREFGEQSSFSRLNDFE